MASREEHFVADGYDRAREAAQASIEEDVAREYMERLATAGFFRRFLLRYQMRR
jgi:hypothetical protein